MKVLPIPRNADRYFESQLHLANERPHVTMRRASLRELFEFVRGMSVGFNLFELLLLAFASAGLLAFAIKEELRYRAIRRFNAIDEDMCDRFAARCMKFSVIFVALFLAYQVLLAFNTGAFDRAVR